MPRQHLVSDDDYIALAGLTGTPLYIKRTGQAVTLLSLSFFEPDTALSSLNNFVLFDVPTCFRQLFQKSSNRQTETLLCVHYRLWPVSCPSKHFGANAPSQILSYVQLGQGGSKIIH